jgi:hypothetical protein
MKYVYHHLGLGDHIICNGMVRHFCELYDEITLFCYSHYANNVKCMFRDLKNLIILDFKNEEEINLYIAVNNIKNDLIKIGFENLQHHLTYTTFDKAFYILANLDFDIRFSKFYYQRNIEKENLVCKTLNPDNKKYIFLMDDPQRGFNIDMNKVSKKYKIIRNNYNFMMFDYIKLLENAEEIHTMQTGFLDLINSYKMNKPKIYRHTYVRQYPPSIHSVGLNSIQEI